MTPKILAIDDSRTIRELLRGVMVNAGFDFACANDGVEGVSVFADYLPDLVITDINMPKMDGYGVINAIRGGSVEQSVPILVLTTESGDAMKARARAAGATGWIVKPFDDVSLVSVIRRLTGARV